MICPTTEVLPIMETIVDLQNYVWKRQANGKSAVEIRQDLIDHGYDFHAAAALVMRYWDFGDEDTVEMIRHDRDASEYCSSCMTRHHRDASCQEETV